MRGLFPGRPEASFRIFADVTSGVLRPEAQVELLKAGVETVHVPSLSKREADLRLLNSALQFAAQQQPPASIVLLSGDPAYAPGALQLRRSGFEVIVAHNAPVGAAAPAALAAAASVSFAWRDLCAAARSGRLAGLRRTAGRPLPPPVGHGGRGSPQRPTEAWERKLGAGGDEASLGLQDWGFAPGGHGEPAAQRHHQHAQRQQQHQHQQLHSRPSTAGGARGTSSGRAAAVSFGAPAQVQQQHMAIEPDHGLGAGHDRVRFFSLSLPTFGALAVPFTKRLAFKALSALPTVAPPAGPFSPRCTPRAPPPHPPPRPRLRPPR